MINLIKVEPADELAWGQLVRSWATGKNHLVSGQPAPKPPETLEDLLGQCKAAGITLRVPDYITDYKLLVMPKNTFVLRLPAKELVEEIEAELRKPHASYPIPHYYDDAYGIHLEVPNPDKRVELQTFRIGDYSISHCG